VISAPIKAVSFNAQWPEFGSTRTKVAHGSVRPWPTRRSILASRIRAARPSLLMVQELGQTEAAELAEDLGSAWSYQRLTLNCVFWRDDVFDFVKTRELVLPDFGQWPGRSYLEVWLKDKSGNRLRVGSSHFSVKTPHDAANQQAQAQKIASFVNDEADDWPLVVGVDTNNRQTALLGGVWRVLRKYGWTWDRSGIDAVLWNYGVKIDRVDRFDLGAGSDHDGRVFTLRTTKA
jgi:hypothetical protein